jgi:hypothetical protein
VVATIVTQRPDADQTSRPGLHQREAAPVRHCHRLGIDQTGKLPAARPAAWQTDVPIDISDPASKFIVCAAKEG